LITGRGPELCQRILPMAVERRDEALGRLHGNGEKSYCWVCCDRMRANLELDARP
jgi:hypothetical protein